MPLSFGFYINDFICFSCNDKVKAKFQHILSWLTQVKYIGVVEWFLGTHFSWRNNNTETPVHMN